MALMSTVNKHCYFAKIIKLFIHCHMHDNASSNKYQILSKTTSQQMIITFYHKVYSIAISDKILLQMSLLVNWLPVMFTFLSFTEPHFFHV